MKHEEFERIVRCIYEEFYYGGEIVVFAQYKYSYEKEYERFEIIISEEDERMIIDWDYQEGKDDYLIDGWEYLHDIIFRNHLQGTFRTLRR